MLAKTERISVYQPEQEGREFPQVPVFATPAEERDHRKRRLVAACRAFALHGLDYGFAGHLTVRDPEFPDLYWTNPMAVHFTQVKLSNLLLADHDGRVREGRHALNRAGFVLHSAVHEAHPDIVAMCHAHTVYGVAWAAMGRLLDPITQDACCFFEDHVVIADEGGAVTVERDAGKKVAAAFKGVKAAIHRNHGLMTASRHSIESAAFWFIALERCCRQQLMIDATGRPPVLVPPERARYSREHVGSDYIGWLHFQPIYDRLMQTDPDMFD
jgi:ribulose-5-phosphate 4-epimerase/fuculose-1-phosphate aldolase